MRLEIVDRTPSPRLVVTDKVSGVVRVVDASPAPALVGVAQARGYKGDPGDPGPPGADGDPGPAGADGVARPWDGAKVYAAGVASSKDGILYLSRADGNTGNDPSTTVGVAWDIAEAEPLDNSVTNAKIAAGAAIDVSKLAHSATNDDLLATRAGVPVWISAATLGLILAGDSRLSDTRTPTDGTVTTAKIVDAAVTSAKLADGAVTSSKLPTVGPGAGAIGGVGSCVQSVTLDAQGRVTAATAASLPTALPPTAGSVVDASVSATAAIAVSKLATGAVNTVLKGGASANSFAQIVDADISSSAAIAGSKISPVFGAQNITGSAKITVCAAGGVNNATNGAIVGGGGSPTLSGAATSSGILAGNGASVSGAYAAACGGSNLTVSGGYGFAGGGVTNVAGADRSACVGGTSGTIASGCDNSTTSGGLTNSIAKGLGHHIAGSTLCTIGNASLAAGNYSAIIASTSCLIGTTTAGATNCAIVASSGSSSIQGAASSCAVVGSGGSGIGAATYGALVGTQACSLAAGVVASAISGGYQCAMSASAVGCSIAGGYYNAMSASTTGGFSGGGIYCTVGGNYSATIGSMGAVTSMHAQVTHAGGYTTAAGERQASEVIIRCDTSGAQTGSLLGGVVGGAPTQPLLTAAARSYTVYILVNVHKTVAVASDIAVCAGWEIKAVVYNQSGTVSVQPGYTVTQLQTTLPAGLVGATVTLSGSGNNLVVTGDIGSGNTISTKWSARANWIENG